MKKQEKTKIPVKVEFTEGYQALYACMAVRAFSTSGGRQIFSSSFEVHPAKRSPAKARRRDFFILTPFEEDCVF